MITFLVIQCLILGSLACHCDKGYKNILVKKNDRPGCSKQNETIHCQFLSDALALGEELNNSCVIVYNSEYLYDEMPLSGISNMTICGMSPIYIYCRNVTKENIYYKDVGLSIENSFNIRISKVNFESCGAKHPLFYTDVDAGPPFITAALYVNFVWNITLNDVTFGTSLGYGAIFIDAFQLRLISVIAKANIQIPYKNGNETFSTFGGGVIISYFKEKHSKDVNTVSISNGKYEKNNSTLGTYIKPEDYSTPLGGAICLIFGKYTKNNNVMIENVDFEMNSAYFGGGLYVVFDDHAINNTITCNICLFDRNQAQEGGGIFVQGVPQKGELRNRIEIISSYFIYNTAVRGGGFQYRQPGKFVRNTFIILNDTRFESNCATYASAVIIYNATLIMVNSRIVNHVSGNSIGTVILYKTYASVYGEVKFSNNTDTALVMESTFISIYHTLIFNDNNGNNGGGMALYGHSVIFLRTNTAVLKFIGNHAKSRGGALYVSVPGPNVKPSSSSCINRYKCFFILDKQHPTVIFERNRAISNEGNSIFASTLQNCCKNKNQHGNFFPNFKFDKHKYAISTNPIDLKLLQKQWNRLVPGIHKILNITLLDELNNTVSDTINVVTTNVGILSQSIALVKDSTISFNVFGNLSEKFNVTIILPSSASVSKKLANLKLAYRCPVGFSYNKNRQVCMCKSNPRDYVAGIAQCFGDRIYLYNNFWAAPLSSTPYPCPEGYCKNCTKEDSLTGAECLYQPDSQCDRSRNQSSRLCSQCNSTWSVHLKAGKCSDCSGTLTFLWEFLRFFMDLVFIMFALYLNKDRYTSYFNPVIYSYQIIAQVLPSNMPAIKYGIRLIVIVIGGSHDHEIFDKCYIDGMNDLNKHWILLLHAGEWILGFPIAYWLFSCCNKPPNDDTFFRTFNFVYLMSCCTILKFCFLVLKSIIIDSKRYVFVYAAVEYLSDDHIPYFVAAIILLAVILILFLATLKYTLTTSMTDFLQICTCCSILERPFKYGFKTKKQATETDEGQRNMACFSLFYVFCAAILLCLAIMVEETSKFTWMNTVSLLFTLVFICFEPYKDDAMNYVNVIILGNTMVVLSILDGYLYLNKSGPILLNVFLLVPFLILLVMLVHNSCSFYNCRKYLPNLPITIRSGSTTDALNIPWRVRMMSRDHPVPENNHLIRS